MSYPDPPSAISEMYGKKCLCGTMFFIYPVCGTVTNEPMKPNEKDRYRIKRTMCMMSGYIPMNMVHEYERVPGTNDFAVKSIGGCDKGKDHGTKSWQEELDKLKATGCIKEVANNNKCCIMRYKYSTLKKGVPQPEIDGSDSAPGQQAM